MPPFLRIRKLTIQPEQSLASSPSPHNHSSIANNARMPSYSKPEHVSIAALPTHQRQPHQQEATGLRRSSRIVRGDGQNGAAEGYTSFESAPPFHISQVPARSLHAMPPAAPVNADRLSSRPLSRQSGSSPRSRHSGSRAPAPPALTLHTALSADELSHHRQHGQARGQLTLPTPPLTAVKQRGVQGKSRSGGSGSYARPKTRSEKTRQPPKEGTCLHCGCDHTQAKQWRSNPLPGATKDDQLCSKCGIYASSHMKRRPASLDAGNRSFSADVPRSSGNSIGPIRPRSAAKACRKSRRAVSAAVPTTSRRSSASSSPRKSTFGPLSSAPLCSARLPSLAESVYDSADAFSQAQSSSQELPSPMDSAYPITPISALGPLLPSPAVISSANGWPYREELSLGGHLSSKSDVAKYPSSLSRAAHVMQPSSSAADPSLADICPCRIEEGDTWYTLIAASRIASAAEEAQTVPRLLPVPVAADTFAQIDRSDSSLSPAVARRMMSIADLCGGDRAASSGGMDVDGADAEWKEDVRRGGMLGRAERESSDAAEALLQIQHSSPRSSSPLIDLPASYRTSPPYCPSSLPTNAYTQAVSVSQPTRPHSSRPSVSRWPSYKHQDLRPSHYYNEPQGLVRPQPILPVATQGGRDLPSLASLFPRTSSGVGARAVSGLGMQGGEGVRRGSARLGAW